MIHRISVVVLALVLVLSWSTSLTGANETADALKKEYKAIEKKFDAKLKEIKSRKEYQQLFKDWKAEVETFLEKVKKGKPGDDLEMLKGKILFELKKTDEAITIYDNLIKKKSPLALVAKFNKVRALLRNRDAENALALFTEVEKENKTKKAVKIDKVYAMVLLELSYATQDKKTGSEYSDKFLKTAEKLKEPSLERFVAMIYDRKASAEVEKGNKKKAIEILETAMKKLTSERAKNQLQGSLKQLKMVGTPAPEVNAANWLNSSALKLGELKGKAVIIDFWATWCGPCRMVIPSLVKKYNEYKDKGLVVIGFTRIYGSYSDENGSKGKVSPEKERELIGEFVKRHKITYPIAIAGAGDTAGFDAYGVRGIPTMVMIDKKGNVKTIEVGAGNEKALEEKIDALLK